jgi:hypothetical protein
MDQNIYTEEPEEGPGEAASQRVATISAQLAALQANTPSRHMGEIIRLTEELKAAEAEIPQPTPPPLQLDVAKINSLTIALDALLKNPRQNEAAIKHLSAELDAVLPRG